MQTVTDLQDGARIVHHGSGREAVLFMGRQNFAVGGAVAAGMAGLFRDKGLGFMHFESPYEVVNLRIDPGRRLDALPGFLRKPLRGLLLLARPRTWKFLLPAVRRRHGSASYCAQSVAHGVAALPRPPLLLVGHSRGAWVLSLAADRCGVAGLICFGYPFRHPQEGEDSGRTAHLAHLRTPCLILQGEGDDYGGRDVPGRYPLSPEISLEFLESDHDLAMSPAQWRDMSGRIGRFAEACRASSAGSGACR